MSQKVITITEDMTILKAAKLMDKSNIGALPVVNGNKPVGIVTERDIIRRVVAKGKNCSDVLVKNIMTHTPVSINDNTSVLEISRIMSEKNFRRVLVVNKGKLVGIVTAKDIINITST